MRTETKILTHTRTVTAHAARPSQPPGSISQTYSGNGGKNLGTITVSTTSTLRWTNDGTVFQILDDENAVEVNSQGHSGTTVLEKGTYHHFQVNAVGTWTMTISAGG